MPSAAPPPEIIAQFARVSRSAHVAAYTLTVFEWLLCLPQEVKLIHKSRWTPAKAAYLFSRYFPLFTYPIVMWVQIAEHTKEECSNIYKLPMYLAVPNNFVAEILLTLRTYALTGGNKTIFGGLLGLLSSMIIYLLWMISVKTSQMPGGMACFPIPNGHKMYLTSPFVCMVAYDTLVTGIFIYFAMKAVRLRLAIADQVLKTLVREGFIYFICISAVNIINVGFNLQSNVAMATGAVPLSLLMCNVLACRLVLNLRQVGRRQSRMAVMSQRPTRSGGSKGDTESGSVSGGASRISHSHLSSLARKSHAAPEIIEMDMTTRSSKPLSPSSASVASSPRSPSFSTMELHGHSPATSPLSSQQNFRHNLLVPHPGTSKTRSIFPSIIAVSTPLSDRVLSPPPSHIGTVSFADRLRPLPPLPPQ